MSCEAKEQAVAKLQLRRLRAAHLVQHEKAKAESDVRRSDARIYDWGAVRFAETLKRCWDSRCAQAEDALTRCKERERNRKAAARFN